MAEDIIINKVPSSTASAKDIFIDLQPTPPFEPAVTALFYWRFEDEPESNYQYLGQQTVGAQFQIPFDPQGREIRISMIGKSAEGVQSTYDPREGVQTTFQPPSVFDGIVTHEGAVVTHEGNIVTHTS